jgi:hypothetical protein
MLSRDPAHNMYLLGLMEEFGIVSNRPQKAFTFYGRMVGDEVTAALFVGGEGGLVVPSASSTSHISELAKAVAPRIKVESLLGEASLVDTLVRAFALTPSFVKTQKLFSVSPNELGPFTNPLLRLATPADVPQLVPLAAAYVRELVKRDPLQEDPTGFELRVRQRVKAERTYVLEENNHLVFKLDVGCRSQFGAELEGVYTGPDHRKKGHATLCLGQISRFLMSSLPRLTVRVDNDAPHFAQIARKVGYLQGRAQKFVWV